MAEAINRSPRSGRSIYEWLDHIEYRVVTTPQERLDIYRLRYRAYLDEKTIEPNAKGIVTDRFDDLPNSWIFGIYIDDELTSSLRVSVASPDFPETPSMDVFPELLKSRLAAGHVMVDPTRFVADPDRTKRFPELPYLTLRLAYLACEYFHANLGLASVRSEHQAFYRRVLMHPLAPARIYPGLTKPISLMGIEFPEMRDKVFARYPFLQSTVYERQQLFGREPVFAASDLCQATIAPQ